jgi:hypothetical protein
VSFKTDRLAALFPEVYAAREGASLLHRLLDAAGAELMDADAEVKRLLKSHWVDYAEADALDGLAANFGVQRRLLADGTMEPDEGFRRRLKGVVPYFTGGGTVKAVSGAVRSALGLPFDLELFRREIAGPGGDPTGRFDPLIQGLADLVKVQEFSPRAESVLSGPVDRIEPASEVTVEVAFSSVIQVYPRIEWTFTSGGARFLTLQRLDSGEGVKSRAALRVNPGEQVVFTADSNGALRASLGFSDISSQFTAWDGTSPPMLPQLPGETTQWRFTARSGTFDLSTFDDTEGFGLPDFSIRFEWIRYLPLTFDVIVPYFIKPAVESLQRQTGYQGKLFLFEGLPLDVIQKVVHQTRAAGVQGMVHFSLNFVEDHGASERMTGLMQQKRLESQDMSEALVVGNLTSMEESHDVGEAFALGGVFDISTFDGSFGFH